MTSQRPILAGLAVGAVLAVTVAVFALRGGGESEQAADAAISTIPPLPSTPAKVAADPPSPVVTTPVATTTGKLEPEPPDPAPPAPPAPAQPECAEVCCGGTDCVTSAANAGKPDLCNPKKERCEACPSGRTCIPMGCGEYIAPDGQWLLRLAIALGPVEMGQISLRDSHPEAEVCLRPSARPKENWTCTPVTASRKSTYETRTLATTTDLQEDGIDIAIRERGDRTPFAFRLRARHEDKVKVTALCRGLIFREIVGRQQTYTITLHLDDPI
jgi:hypothetical protein